MPGFELAPNRVCVYDVIMGANEMSWKRFLTGISLRLGPLNFGSQSN